MTRKTDNAKKPAAFNTDTVDAPASKELLVNASTAETGVDKALVTCDKKPPATKKATVQQPVFNVVLEGKGKKLSPKTTYHVFYEVGISEDDDELYLRLSSNEGGGLHSKEWIKVDSILELLDQQDDRPFKSTVFKSVFKGASANNAAFLAAAIRGEGLGLIGPSEKSVFLHVVTGDYADRKAALLALNSPK
jgi:hypothetical protein